MAVSETRNNESVGIESSLPDGDAAAPHSTLWVERLHLLHAVTVALGRVKTSEEVADVITTVAMQGIGATRGGLFLLTDDGRTLETLRLVGYPPSVMSLLDRFPLDIHAPVCDAVRTHDPILLPTIEARRQCYPHLPNEPWLEQQGSVAALPLLMDERALGAVELAFPEGRTFDANEVLFLLTLIGQCAQALERTRRLEAERNARKRQSELYEQAQVELRQRQAAQESLQAERERLGAIDAALRASESLYRTLGEAAPDIVWAADATGKPDYVNRAWAEYTGQSVEKICEGGMKFIHPSGDLPAFVRGWEQAKANGKLFEAEFRYRRHDGEYRWFLSRAVPVKDEQGIVVRWVGTSIDIHERKMATDALRLHVSVLENMAEGVVATDEEGIIILTNPAFDAMFGYAPGELLGQSVRVLNAYSAEEYAQITPLILAAHQEGKTWAGEFRNRKKDGAVFTSRALISIQVADGKRRFIAVQEDITERKQMHAALEQSEERSRSLVEVLTAVVWTTDGMGAFITPQVAWERYTGQSWKEHRGFGWMNVLHPDDRDRVVAAWEQTVVERSTYRVEGRIWHADSQRYRHFMARATPLLHADGTIREWVGSVEDVDDAKQHEEEILALNARLRLGMRETHHRVKNNLQIIGAMLDISLMDAVDALPLADAQRVANQVQMLAKIHDILTAEARFDRFGADISSQLVLERLLPMLQSTSGVQLTANIGDIPLTAQQATSLALVVNELVSNAVKYGQGLVEVEFTVSGGQGILRVSDNGDGFPAGFDFRIVANTGLMIVEQVVRHDLGGLLRFANRIDQRGADVCVTIPLRVNPK